MKTLEQKIFRGLVIGFIVISVAAIVIFAIALAKKDNTVDDMQKYYINITANQLQAEYEKNVANADEVFKGKLLQLSGRVDDISSAMFEGYHLKLKTDGDYSIVCKFESNEDLKNLKAGDSVVIKGICKGETIVVYIDDCTLMK